jgi:hypothetical protein
VLKSSFTYVSRRDGPAPLGALGVDLVSGIKGKRMVDTGLTGTIASLLYLRLRNR